MTGLESNIWKLYVIKALRWFMLIIPVIVLFWQENGLSMQQIFILQSLFSLVIIFSEIPSGFFSDVIGRKKTIVLGCFLGGLGFTIYSLSYGFWGFLAAEMTLGLGSSFISGTDSALLYDSLAGMNRPDAYKKTEGRMMSAGNFSEGIASIAGGFTAVISLRFNMYLETFLFWMTVPLALSLTEPPRRKYQNTRGAVKEIFSIVQFSLYSHREIKWLIIYSAATGASTLVMVWLTQPYFKLVGLPLAWFGIVWGILNLSVGVFALLSHRFEALVGRKNTLISLTLLTFTGFTLLSWNPSLYGILIIFIFYFVRGIAGPLVKDYVNRLTPSDRRATVLSVKNMASRLTFALIGPFIGWTTDHYSLQVALATSGWIFLTMGMVTLLFLKKHRAL